MRVGRRRFPARDRRRAEIPERSPAGGEPARRREPRAGATTAGALELPTRLRGPSADWGHRLLSPESKQALCRKSTPPRTAQTSRKLHATTNAGGQGCAHVARRPCMARMMARRRRKPWAATIIHALNIRHNELSGPMISMVLRRQIKVNHAGPPEPPVVGATSILERSARGELFV